MKVRDMTRGSAMRLILSTALPLMLGNMFQQMYTIVDASVVGRGIGLQALAALGSADWFNWLFFSIALGFAQGFSIPVAQAFGAKGSRALTLDELEKALTEAFNCDGPYIIDCAIDKDEFVLPMLPPGGSMDDIIVRIGD